MALEHWVGLATSARIGGKLMTRLLAHFGSVEAVFEADEDELQVVSGIGVKIAAAIIGVDLNQIAVSLTAWEQSGIKILTWESPDYPANLLQNDDAPPVLFLRGTLHPSDKRAVAIIGTRKATPDFLQIAHRLGYDLAERGFTVISGLALGIDTAAHKGALAAGGRTLAVLGSGLDQVYPPQNLSLSEQMIDCGGLLSELHPHTVVNAQNLIARNRIVSTLGKGVIVVQTEMKGGSMNTARRALSNNQRVLAVVGGGEGCDYLLGKKAHPIHPNWIVWDQLLPLLDSPPDSVA